MAVGLEEGRPRRAEMAAVRRALFWTVVRAAVFRAVFRGVCLRRLAMRSSVNMREVGGVRGHALKNTRQKDTCCERELLTERHVHVACGDGGGRSDGEWGGFRHG
jgi:hypothetical protein